MRRFTNWNGDKEEDIITASRRKREAQLLNQVEVVIVDMSGENSERMYRNSGGRFQPYFNEALRTILQRSLYDQELKRDDSVVLDVDKTLCSKEDEKQDCSVCMTNLSENEYKSTLSCSHTFHYDCIQEWGKHKQECPLCREKISIK
jgi:hypothetical protein